MPAPNGRRLMMRHAFIIVFCLLASLCIKAQERLDSAAMNSLPLFTNLDTALAHPEQVYRLALRKKKLKEFPMQILTLKNLQYLDLSRNFLKALPDSIITLSNLQYLMVSKNSLTALPANIGELKKLKLINVNQNEIAGLPDSFGGLSNLEVADLWSNDLGYFPESMGNLQRLKWMDLRNILIPQDQQNRIQSMVPGARIEFSPPCKCSW